MADKAISELVAAEQIKSTDMFVLEQDGTAKRLQGQTLLNWLTAAADGHGGISNIAKTGTDGLVDTYTITLADTTTKTFTVTNGNGLTAFEKLSTVGLVDTYRFTRSDGTYFTFAVSNGAKGDTGDASHVWIKYASQQPTANSHSIGDNPDDWMGIYSGTAETAPTDWQAYSWYQIKGDKGDTGAPATVTGVTVEYIVSDSGTIVPSGSWSTTIPSVPQGKYLWTRSTTNFNTGNPAVSYSVTRMGIDGSGSVSSVNDKSPSDSGNVTLTAGDIQTSENTSVEDELNNAVKYNTPQTLTDAQKQQARENINAPAPYEAGDNIAITGRIITTKAFPCNPNLLDNWYFGNPVNQRGKTSYTGTSGYCIDRWIITGDNPQLTVTSGSLKEVGYLVQKADNSNLFEGMQLTLSALMSDNTFGSVTFHLSKGMVNPIAIRKNDYIVYAEWANTNDFFTVNWKTDSETVGLVAIKLELGPQQTLAHQENGVWVLNEIPKFGDQLAECLRYYYRLSGNQPLCTGYIYDAETVVAVIDLPATMRVSPAITVSGSVAIRGAGGMLVLASTVEFWGFAGDKCQLRITVPGASMTPGSPCDIYMASDSSIAFSADL